MAAGAVSGWGNDWPQFRGPAADQKTDEKIAIAWPAAGPRVVWKKDIGEGFGQVAVAGGKAFYFAGKGNREVVYMFGHYVRQMIADTASAGAHPVVLSLTVRNIWKDGKVERGSGRFSAWSEEIAKTGRSCCGGAAFVHEVCGVNATCPDGTPSRRGS